MSQSSPWLSASRVRPPQPQLRGAVMQIAAVHAERAGGGGPVAAVCADRGENHAPLEVLELLAQRPPGSRGVRIGASARGALAPRAATSRCAGVTVTMPAAIG